MTYIPPYTVIEGGETKTFVEDLSGHELLTNILKEMKKLNIYMALEHDLVITNSEIEV